jgi:organic radical activating enzyme
MILTGGSPLKQERRLINFLNEFEYRYGFLPYTEVENEAVLMPSEEFVDLVSWWNNSPKLANSGMKERVRIKPEVLKFMGEQPNAVFKFVVSSEQDWEEIERDFIKPGYIPRGAIVIMPEGQTQEELSKTREMAADMAIKQQVRFTDRLHVTIWNKKTGV